MQRGALAPWHAAWYHKAVTDECQLHADDPEINCPFPRRGSNRTTLPKKVQDVLPIILQVEVIARRDTGFSLTVARLQETPHQRNVADNSGQFLAQRIDETVAPLTRRSDQPVACAMVERTIRVAYSESSL